MTKEERRQRAEELRQEREREATLAALRHIRDNPQATPGERLEAIKLLHANWFDLSDTQEECSDEDKKGIDMSKELMRRTVIDMILWTDSEEKLKIVYRFLCSLLKRSEDGSYE